MYQCRSIVAEHVRITFAQRRVLGSTRMMTSAETTLHERDYGGSPSIAATTIDPLSPSISSRLRLSKSTKSLMTPTSTRRPYSPNSTPPSFSVAPSSPAACVRGGREAAKGVGID